VVDEGRMLSSAEVVSAQRVASHGPRAQNFHRTLRLLDDPNKKIGARLSPIPPERLPHNPRSGHIDLDEVIEQYHEALEKFSRGDPEPVKRLYSHRGDVVLANPFGPAVRGWDQASQALEYASSRFRDGEVTAFEKVARYASADLVVIHEKEQWQAKVSGGEELSRFGLRVTSTFRREDSTWKLVHRHADPITTADPKGPLRGSVR
jgi:ketosteroid isomerase-like protein